MKIKIFIQNTKFKIYYFSFFKIKTFTQRKLNGFFKFNRPSSYPYITGDSFRSLATHIYDDLQEVNVKNVMENDIVFVRGDFLHTYFKKIHPKIKNKYILISHNADTNITDVFEKYIDDKIIHLFSRNLMFKHEKCTPIPIGLQHRIYDNKNKVIECIKKIKIIDKKINKIFYAFTEETNIIRSVALKSLSSNFLSEKPEKKLTREQYYIEVSKHAFNASPEGNGVDCHRTWETIHLGGIPIIGKSVNSEYWKLINLPVLIINSWEDINNFDENFIRREFKEIIKNSNNSGLYMDYWIKEIYNKIHK